MNCISWRVWLEIFICWENFSKQIFQRKMNPSDFYNSDKQEWLAHHCFWSLTRVNQCLTHQCFWNLTQVNKCFWSHSDKQEQLIQQYSWTQVTKTDPSMVLKSNAKRQTRKEIITVIDVNLRFKVNTVTLEVWNWDLSTSLSMENVHVKELFADHVSLSKVIECKRVYICL